MSPGTPFVGYIAKRLGYDDGKQERGFCHAAH